MIRHKLRQILSPSTEPLHAALFGGNRKRANDVVASTPSIITSGQPSARTITWMGSICFERSRASTPGLPCNLDTSRHECLAFGVEYARAILCVDVFRNRRSMLIIPYRRRLDSRQGT